MPRKACTPSRTVPRTAPPEVWTVGVVAVTGADASPRRAGTGNRPASPWCPGHRADGGRDTRSCCALFDQGTAAVDVADPDGSDSRPGPDSGPAAAGRE